MRPLDLIGNKYGKLLVVEKALANGRNTRFVCLCDCGNERVILASELKRGNHKSCGCKMGKPITTKYYREHPLYNVWKGMKARCRDKNHRGYHIYGGIGVKVCELWQKNFIAFYDWSIANGWEQGLQIDKDIIAKKLGIKPLLYSPDFCCWITQSENNQNRKNTKLTFNKVEEIRKSNLPEKELSVIYNVGKTHIQKIKNNKRWKK